MNAGYNQCSEAGVNAASAEISTGGYLDESDVEAQGFLFPSTSRTAAWHYDVRDRNFLAQREIGGVAKLKSKVDHFVNMPAMLTPRRFCSFEQKLLFSSVKVLLFNAGFSGSNPSISFWNNLLQNFTTF